MTYDEASVPLLDLFLRIQEKLISQLVRMLVRMLWKTKLEGRHPTRKSKTTAHLVEMGVGAEELEIFRGKLLV